MNEKFYIDQNADILPPKDDLIFKSLLTRSEPESKIVLMDLISSIIGRKVTDVAIKGNEPAKTDTEEKAERLDINCEIDGNELVDMEMQCSYIKEKLDNSHKNCKNKSVHYGCDLFSSQSLKGKRYDQAVKTYQITFVAYTVFPKLRKYKNEFKLRSEDGEILTDELVIIFIELSKLKKILKKPIEDMTDLEMWSIFLECADNPKYRKTVNKIIEKKEEIQMASALLQSISQDDHERAKLRSRRMFETDQESNLLTAINNRELEIAKNLMEMGLSNEQIAKGTGLTIAEIEKIKK